MSEITLTHTDKGYTITANGKTTKPFPKLKFKDTMTTTLQPDGTSIIQEESELMDLLKESGLNEDERLNAYKHIKLELLAKWREANPTNSIGKNRDIYQQYMDYLSRTIKHDTVLKQVIFLTALSASSPNPLNLFIRGPSSTGKGWTGREVVKLFPEENKMMLGGLSPTALIHSKGELVDENGEPIDAETVDWKSPDLKRYKTVVNLKGKILVFLEAPKQETFNNLRPILSHDVAETEYQVTDKSGRGQLRTKKVFLKGWPAMINCSVDTTYQEELATRSINITPEMNEEKYGEANVMQGKNSANIFEYHNPNEEYETLTENLKQVMSQMENYTVVLPFGEELAKCYPHSEPRDMRDIGKLISLIQQYTYLHLWQRPVLNVGEEKKKILATLKDFKEMVNLFNYVSETTRSGIPGHVVDFFKKVMIPLHDEFGSSITYLNISQKNIEVYNKSRSKTTLKRVYLDPLKDVGWIDSDRDPDDTRANVFMIIGKPAVSLEKYEEKFFKMFDAGKLSKWIEGQKAEKYGKLSYDGREMDWADFQYSYFNEWI